MDEQGRLQAELIHTVEIELSRGHSASFKFKQMAQGSIKRVSWARILKTINTDGGLFSLLSIQTKEAGTFLPLLNS